MCLFMNSSQAESINSINQFIAAELMFTCHIPTVTITFTLRGRSIIKRRFIKFKNRDFCSHLCICHDAKSASLHMVLLARLKRHSLTAYGSLLRMNYGRFLHAPALH